MEVKEGRIVNWSYTQLESKTYITKILKSLSLWENSAKSVVPRLWNFKQKNREP